MGSKKKSLFLFEENKKKLIFCFLKYFNKEPLPSNLLQAQVPSKATILFNSYGTAPGMWMEKDDTVFVAMPGVPYEMKYLLKDSLLPKIIKNFIRPHIYHKMLLTYGMGESDIAHRISDWEENLPQHIKLSYLPALGRVRLRLSSKGADEQKLRNEVDGQMEIVHKMLSDIAVGFEGETSITQKIGELLIQQNKTLSLVESFTGGALAEEITRYAGASAFYRGGIIPYATELKISILGVSDELIKKHSVVSLPVAESMAERGSKIFLSDYTIATTGIAGPTKGDGDDEIGTVCIGIAAPNGVISEKFLFGKVRERVIQKSVSKAFEMLLKEISKN